MIDPEVSERVSRLMPFLRRADPPLAEEFARHAFLARIPSGKDVFVEGDPIDAIALLISGVVRVYKVSETGREITLYRFGLGGLTGVIVAVVGAVPLAAGLLDVCLFAPLFGASISGPKIRAAR